MINIAWVVLVLAMVSACAQSDRGGSARPTLNPKSHTERFVVLPVPPAVAAPRMQAMVEARQRASTIRPSALAARQDARALTVDALPFLANTDVGRQFLAASPPRALARGAPAAQCPATGFGTADPEGGRPAAAEAALAACLAALPPGAIDCGCELLAIDTVLTVPLDQVAYATGVTARISAPALGLDRLLVAEAEPGGAVLLRGPEGPVAMLRRAPDGTVTLSFDGTAEVYRGRAIPVGFRRGRLAERVYVASGESRVSLLIGFPPRELAEVAGSWLTWPQR